MIVLFAQKEVDKQNCHRSAGEGHDTIAQEQEAEHVVDSAKPDIVEYEIKLDENRAER